MCKKATTEFRIQYPYVNRHGHFRFAFANCAIKLIMYALDTPLKSINPFPKGVKDTRTTIDRYGYTQTLTCWS